MSTLFDVRHISGLAILLPPCGGLRAPSKDVQDKNTYGVFIETNTREAAERLLHRLTQAGIENGRFLTVPAATLEPKTDPVEEASLESFPASDPPATY